MKKIISSLILISILGTFATLAQAETLTVPTCPTGQHSSATVGADGFTPVSYSCVADTTSGGCVTINGVTNCSNSSGSQTSASTDTTCPGGGTKNANGSCNLGYTPLEPVPGLTTNTGSGGGSLVDPNNLHNIINAIFKILITAGALMAVFSLTLGGIQYMVSGSAGGKNAGIKRAQAALWAILLIAASWLILNTVNPQLLKFSLNPCPQGGTTCTVTAAPATTNTNSAAQASAAAPIINQLNTETPTADTCDSARLGLGQTSITNASSYQQVLNSLGRGSTQMYYVFKATLNDPSYSISSNIQAGSTAYNQIVAADTAFVARCSASGL